MCVGVGWRGCGAEEEGGGVAVKVGCGLWSMRIRIYNDQ